MKGNLPAEPGSPPVAKWLVAISVMGCAIIEIMDGSMINVALPHIAGSMAASVDEATWALTCYDVATAIIMPITGWLSARFGRKRFLLVCLLLFVGSSMLCGLAPSLGTLIFFRILQGLGGGALQPLSQAILLETFPPEKRGEAMGLWGMGVVTAPIMAPVVGGWLADNWTWRWAFYINIPITLVTIALIHFFITDPEYIRAQRAKRIDYLGLGLLCLSVSTLQILLDRGQREDWFDSVFIIRLSLICVVSLIWLIRRELKVSDPIIDLRLLQERNFGSGASLMFFYTMVRSGSVMMLPLFLQTLMGYDATTAGLALAYSGIGAIILAPIAGRLSTFIDSRLLVVIGLALHAYAAYQLGLFNTQIDFYTAWWPRLLQGFGNAITFVCLTTLTMARIPAEKMGNATGMFSLMRNLGEGIGIAVTTTLLARRTQFHQSRLVERVTDFSLPFNEWQQRMGEIFPDLGPYWQLWEGMKQMSDIYHEVQRQAWMLAFCDNYRLFTWVLIILMALVLLMRPTIKKIKDA